jgi:hypothetical protein
MSSVTIDGREAAVLPDNAAIEPELKSVTDFGDDESARTQ